MYTAQSVELFGVTLVGVSITTGVKLVVTAVFVTIVLALRRLVLALTRRSLGGEVGDSRRFWARQGLQVIVAVVLVLGLVSIWVTPNTDITTGVGLISAGLAFALQQVITSLAAYFVILRGDTFGIGDRITLGGVRGDVVRLGFLKTTIMEMGQPPAVSDSDPAIWVNSRQYTGRLVTVTNGVIFTDPVYNYTREFPYLWEEIVLPIAYTDDRQLVEQILLRAARDHAVVDDPSANGAFESMRRRYALAPTSLNPSVYWRITDNWVELSLRFLVPHRGVRAIKDLMTRDILAGLDEAGIGIASATNAIVGIPDLKIVDARRHPDAHQ
ncbi:MAG: mechanosensitive ion channel family protein [Rhodococcus sp. (in: high G+C Gram-positive bacteria)]|uniref:mechanosensitive ion channel family protein n=1 Tax=Rhodococcus sp. SBT000017 TaxID=1803385 RepID=UPI00217D727F|nr:mechanosensitive ion channel family protein [Rhodococcus sp. SBT000017]